VIIFERVIEGVSRPALERFARKAQELTGVAGEVDVLIAGNRRLQQLNRHFRNKNRPTDVLSFPRIEGGDIAVSADMALANARRYRHPATQEIKILILHGMLHLAGYDHENDNGQMARKENKLRVQLKLPASLIDRAHTSKNALRGAGRRSR
jgi:probable rRNA maturation factor